MGVVEDDSGQVIAAPGVQRRSLYLLQRCTQPMALMQAFDVPVMETKSDRRPSSTVATQSLMLMKSAIPGWGRRRRGPIVRTRADRGVRR